MSMNIRLTETADYESPGVLPESVLAQAKPAVLKGFVSHWPSVVYAQKSDEQLVEYLSSFATTERPATYYEAPYEVNRRVFYNASYTGFNFTPGRAPLKAILSQLLMDKKNKQPPVRYVGSTTVDSYLPKFRDDNNIELDASNPIISLWVGNRAKVAAHYDAPDNVACCVSGRRTFTLFPIDQVKNLYVGPIDKTPSGQAISLVDLESPDLAKYPKYKDALAHAQVAELDPGDALFLPSMWWHSVQSHSDINVLINYWFRDSPGYLESPISALNHAILSLRDLPSKERNAWKTLFDYYVFESQSEQYDHIPEPARGFLNPLDEMKSRQLRSWLLNHLNR